MHASEASRDSSQTLVDMHIRLPDYHDNIAFNIPIIDPDPTPQKEIEKSRDIRLLFFRVKLLAYIRRSHAISAYPYFESNC